MPCRSVGIVTAVMNTNNRVHTTTNIPWKPLCWIRHREGRKVLMSSRTGCAGPENHQPPRHDVLQHPSREPTLAHWLPPPASAREPRAEHSGSELGSSLVLGWPKLSEAEPELICFFNQRRGIDVQVSEVRYVIPSGASLSFCGTRQNNDGRQDIELCIVEVVPFCFSHVSCFSGLSGSETFWFKGASAK
ncbi:hypothetical protein R1sor_011894 [Riccia sorocarpa]|uniref:Uncharacterized protein n=1 Tax=Riccia sorocarpa TaxID=122646 RepID=A0ABD3I2A3_9MARC